MGKSRTGSFCSHLPQPASSREALDPRREYNQILYFIFLIIFLHIYNFYKSRSGDDNNNNKGSLLYLQLGLLIK